MVTPDDLRLLAGRARIADDPEQLRSDVHVRIDRMRRRRQVGAVAASVIAVVLVVTAGATVGKLLETAPPPAKRPIPTRTPEPDKTTPARPLVYSEGRRVHVGSRTVDAGGEVIDVDVVDGGAVFATETNHRKQISTVWFTDGSRPVRLGTTHGSAFTSGASMVGSSFGPLVVWHDLASPTRELVVYDTDRGLELGRLGTESAFVVAVFDDYVVWSPDEDGNGSCVRGDNDANGCNRYQDLRRFDVGTGTDQPVSWATYLADRRDRPRLLVADVGSGPKEFFEKTHFTRDGDRLVGGDPGRGPASYGVRDARTGEAIVLRLPRGYDSAQQDFHLSQWLDDESFTVVAGWYGHDEITDGDILLCRTSGGRCRVLVPGGRPHSDLDDRRRVPGHY